MKYLDRFFIKKYSDTLSKEELEKFNVVRERRLNVQQEFEKRYNNFQKSVADNTSIDITFFQWCRDNRDYLPCNMEINNMNKVIFKGELFNYDLKTKYVMECIEKNEYIQDDDFFIVITMTILLFLCTMGFFLPDFLKGILLIIMGIILISIFFVKFKYGLQDGLRKQDLNLVSKYMDTLCDDEINPKTICQETTSSENVFFHNSYKNPVIK